MAVKLFQNGMGFFNIRDGVPFLPHSRQLQFADNGQPVMVRQTPSGQYRCFCRVKLPVVSLGEPKMIEMQNDFSVYRFLICFLNVLPFLIIIWLYTGFRNMLISRTEKLWVLLHALPKRRTDILIKITDQCERDVFVAK